MSGLIETALARFISAGPVWLAPNIRNRLCLSDGILQRRNLSLNTLCHVLQHVKMTQSPCVGPAFTFKQLLHTQWSFSRRKPPLSKFTEAHWAHRHTGNGKRFHRHGHMTRAGSVNGSGETGGESLEWCMSGLHGCNIYCTGCLFFNETYQTQFVYFIFLLRASAPNAVCGVSTPPTPPPPPSMCPAFWSAAVVTVSSRYLDSWKLREIPAPIELLIKRWSHCSADCSPKQHLFC